MNMKMMPIVYVTDMERSVEFYEKLGMQPKTKDRSGMWFEFTAGSEVLALHLAKELPRDTRLSLAFVSTQPLEGVVEQLQTRGLSPEGIVDEAFGRSFLIRDPDGLPIQINEHQEELYT
jgi:catechol 2,3-dioxygenase-like lactoylglutathione lyase family enzyme